MDRKGQLANVAFGGAWSEQIAGHEALYDAMHLIEAAARKTRTTDLRQDGGMCDAMQLLTASHPKGAMLAVAWEKALRLESPDLRAAEVARIAANLRAGLGQQLDRPQG